MATQASKRVMDQRKRDYDQISFVIPKGGKSLARAQALREGCTSAEVMRRALLSRCGLEDMPDGDERKAIDQAGTKEDAERALLSIQKTQAEQHEKTDEDMTAVVTLAGKDERNRFVISMLDLLDAIEDIKEVHTEIKLKKGTLESIYRLMSNIEAKAPLQDPDFDYY